MKKKRVKVHDINWFDTNCPRGSNYKDSYFKYGDFFLSIDFKLAGKEIDIYEGLCGEWFYFYEEDNRRVNIYDWMIEYEVNQQDKSTEKMESFIKYVKESHPHQLIWDYVNNRDAFDNMFMSVYGIKNNKHANKRRNT